MARRACPGAAAGSKWPLKPAPELQNARKVLLKPGPQPCSRSAVRACPAAAECSKSAARACSGATECSKSAARACPGATACARKVLYFVRLLSASAFAQLHFAALGSVLLGRSNWPLGPSRPRCALDQAEPNENEPTRTSQAYPETLRRAGLRMPDPARPRWGARLGRSSPLGLAGALDRTEPNENEPNQTGLRPSLLGDAPLGRTTDACGTQHRDEHTPCIECTGTH